MECSNGNTFAAESLILSSMSWFWPSVCCMHLSKKRNLNSPLLWNHMCLPLHLQFWWAKQVILLTSYSLQRVYFQSSGHWNNYLNFLYSFSTVCGEWVSEPAVVILIAAAPSALSSVESFGHSILPRHRAHLMIFHHPLCFSICCSTEQCYIL